MAANIETVVSPNIEVYRPEALQAELERIAATYQDRKFHNKLHVSTGRFKDNIMKLYAPQPDSYIGRFDRPLIVFGQIPIKEQAELAGLDYYLEGLNVGEWEQTQEGFTTPKRAYLTWMQVDKKYQELNGLEASYSMQPDERGGNIPDAIGLYIASQKIPNGVGYYLPGTLVGYEKSSGIAYLGVLSNKPAISYCGVSTKMPGVVTATCGRNIF